MCHTVTAIVWLRVLWLDDEFFLNKKMFMWHAICVSSILGKFFCWVTALCDIYIKCSSWNNKKKYTEKIYIHTRLSLVIFSSPTTTWLLLTRFFALFVHFFLCRCCLCNIWKKDDDEDDNDKRRILEECGEDIKERI
jgi:hypothetical protein